MEPFIPTNLTKKEIAARLGIGKSTVDKYLANPSRMRVGVYLDMIDMGIRFPLNAPQYMTCDTCHGTGFMEVED